MAITVTSFRYHCVLHPVELSFSGTLLIVLLHTIHYFLPFIGIIREYGSTLYVGLARAVSPTNTNFRLTFLLTRLQEALYEDLAV